MRVICEWPECFQCSNTFIKILFQALFNLALQLDIKQSSRSKLNIQRPFLITINLEIQAILKNRTR